VSLLEFLIAELKLGIATAARIPSNDTATNNSTRLKALDRWRIECLLDGLTIGQHSSPKIHGGIYGSFVWMNALIGLRALLERGRLHQLKAIGAGHATVAEQLFFNTTRRFSA
jgi:hypothetical protein